RAVWRPPKMSSSQGHAESTPGEMARPVRIMPGDDENQDQRITQFLQDVIGAPVREFQPQMITDIARHRRRSRGFGTMSRQKCPLMKLATNQTHHVGTRTQAKKKWITRPVARS